MQRGYFLQAVLAMATLYGCLAPGECLYESQIRAFLEAFRMRMCHPIPNLGLPALDPFILGPGQTSMNNKYLIDFTSIKDFSFLISFRLRTLSPLGITSLQIELYLGDLKINFDNLLEEERINDFVHALVNELGVELLDDIWSYEQGTVVTKAQTLLNNFLGQYSLQDILQIIAGGGGEGGESKPIFEGVEPDCKLESDSSNQD